MLNGMSGSEVKVKVVDGLPIVQKTSCRTDLSHFALKQQEGRKFIAKQATLREWIQVPDTRYRVEDNCITYPYVYALDFVSALEQLPVNNVRSRLRSLVLLLQVELNRATLQKVSSRVITDKARAVRYACLVNLEDLEVWQPVCEHAHEQIVSLAPEVTLPLGFCHGDLTLSNVLFGPSYVTLIDWSPVFVSTPLLDIAKLRQDTLHHWTSRICPRDHNTNVFKLACDWLNTQMDLQLPDWTDTPVFKALELLNYIRILPYATTPNVRDFIYTTLEGLLCC